jgi:serine/threonine protein kinase/formylglycine-generating enzyme required for sulfatase activity
MTPEQFQKASALFDSARRLAANERASFLDDACNDDPSLRRNVDRLLSHHDDDSGILADGAIPAAIGLSEPETPPMPKRIGPYTVLEALGEGGMGTVYLAEQHEPLQRRVAIKLIKAGMDSRQIVARFEAERQALAMMDHAGIARVFDAGTSEDGRPYFVMEHVNGQPITTYCDEQRLDVADRLQLFVDVCHAIEHAHQKGIIHRDIKPSNILVRADGKRHTPTVIDFGIAKAVDPAMEPDTLFTRVGQLLGTPAYMSPEHALDGQDLDTRADVYSLGVLLYELLVGALPYDPAMLRRAAQAEVQRVIRDVDPPRPSTRFNTLDTRDTVAGLRCANPGDHMRRLRGDLDWVTMKALEKDRRRRYGTVSEFAEDVSRHLRNEVVLARPPSMAYRFERFARRNRGTVIAVSALILALGGGLATSLWQYRRAVDAQALTQSSLADVLQLSDIKRIADYRAAANALWPAHPDKTTEMENWLAGVDRLVERLPRHRERLTRLESMADPAPPQTAEDHPQLVELRSMLAGKRRVLANESLATQIRTPEQESNPFHGCRLRHRFDAHAAGAALQLRIRHSAGVAVYVNGTEITRSGLPAGPIGPNTACETAKPSSILVVPFSRQLLNDGANVVAADMRGIADHVPVMQFVAEIRDARGTIVVPLDATWHYTEDATPLAWNTLEYDDSAWASGPGPVGFALRHMFRENIQEQVRQRGAVLRRDIADLEARIAELQSQGEGDVSPQFASPEFQWQHDALAKLVRDLESLSADDPPGLRADVEQRLAFARSIEKRSIRDHQAAWENARAAIADPQQCPAYGGLQLSEQIGLVPIGQDPTSGLWEFAHLQTGDIPERDDDGRIIPSESFGLVLVLIPAGTLMMGDETNPFERPVHPVQLDAYFISKYEMTQGQWVRVVGSNPSIAPPGRIVATHLHDLRHPIDSISWDTAMRTMTELGLILPTEAQWELAARGGTTTRWWCGDDPESLRGVANIADATAIEFKANWKRDIIWEEYNDGYLMSAPAGAYLPNPFGLHEVHGNLSELCRDRDGMYQSPFAEGDGQRQEIMNPHMRMARDGSFNAPITSCRVARRRWVRFDDSEPGMGVRPARTVDR